MAKRYARRWKQIIEHFGGKCNLCGATGRKFETDHIDPETKLFSIGVRLAGVSAKKLAIELEKCQLLCWKCHREKSVTDISDQRLEQERLKRVSVNNKYGDFLHGSHSTYQNKKCRCEACKKAQSEYKKKLRNRGEI
jgi:5-methylcytosine-specific restriction endonuclease McrA